MTARRAGTPGLPTADTDVPALKVLGLDKRFGGVHATQAVSFAVPAGSVTALVGPNGAGKTTLFNLVTNLVRPDAGQVRLFGGDLRGIGGAGIAALGLIRTFQSARVFPGMTALQNVMTGAHRGSCGGSRAGVLSYAAWLPGARRSERALQDRAAALMALIGLDRYRDRHAADLPIGAQKLLEVARALMARPRLLLLDEPAAGLNDSETEELAALLRAIQAGGVAVLVVEHNMGLVMNVADQVVVLDAGRVIACGPPAAVRDDPAVVAAYLGTDPAAGQHAGLALGAA